MINSASTVFFKNINGIRKRKKMECNSSDKHIQEQSNCSVVYFLFHSLLSVQLKLYEWMYLKIMNEKYAVRFRIQLGQFDMKLFVKNDRKMWFVASQKKCFANQEKKKQKTNVCNKFSLSSVYQKWYSKNKFRKEKKIQNHKTSVRPLRK